MQDPIKILGVPVHAMTMQEAVKTLEERMLAKEQTFVVTANAEIIMMCQENAEYKKIICEDADEDVPQIIADINASGADMLFVALGAPKQEKWLVAHRAELNAKILMGIGGSFDVLAGKMERAPKWMQDASLEWAFRLYKQPSRFMRMMALPKFVIKVMASKF